MTSTAPASGSFDHWTDPIEEFARARLEQGIAQTSIDVLRRRLRRVAGDLGGSPWDAQAATLAHYLSGLRVSPSSAKNYRYALRTFYGWDATAGHIAHSPMPAIAATQAPQASRYSLDDRWQDALNLFEGAQLLAGRSTQTVAHRVKHLVRFARDQTVGPWEVEHLRDIREWLEALPGSEQARLAHRVSLRAFYHWGFQAGLAIADPLDEATRRAQSRPFPAEWAPAARSYLTYLRSSGAPKTTTDLRMGHLKQLAYSRARLRPFDVTFEDLVDYLAEHHKWAPETRRSHRASIQGFYEWAEVTGRADENPAANLSPVRVPPPDPRPAMEREYTDALRSAEPRTALMMRLAAELGLRRREVAAIHSRDLLGEGASDSWTLVVHGKGGKRRSLPLPPPLAIALRALPEGYAFPGDDSGHLSPRWVGQVVSRAMPAGVTMHALRHRFATRAYNVGRDVFTLQQILGHASPATTQRYVRVADVDMRALIAAVSD